MTITFMPPFLVIYQWMCHAALPQHWLDAAPTPAERARRRAPPDRPAGVRDGYRVYDRPAGVGPNPNWDRSFDWTPRGQGGRGVLVHESRGRVIETMACC